MVHCGQLFLFLTWAAPCTPGWAAHLAGLAPPVREERREQAVHVWAHALPWADLCTPGRTAHLAGLAQHEQEKK
eukprot:1136900-Pelagomonas_calceolata.AAC.1